LTRTILEKDSMHNTILKKTRCIVVQNSQPILSNLNRGNGRK